jgi:hypothetical protein
MSDAEHLLQDMRTEIGAMHSWFNMAKRQRRRTTTGLSGFSPEQIADLFADFLADRPLPQPNEQQSAADQLRLAAEDLKAFYLEALSAQPGQPGDTVSLANWFWGETRAALVINEVRQRCLESDNEDLLLAGKLLLVPRNQLHRFTR